VLTRRPDAIVVDKPAGLLVHRTALAPDRDVLLTRVRDAIGQRVWPVHRLDRPTSGAVLLALSADAVGAWQQALGAGQKTYYALVRGQAGRHDGACIDRPLSVDGRLRDAETHIRVLATRPDPRCSLLEISPRTGRFHQIRRHLAGIGHPVLGDSSHGDTRVNRAWRPKGLHRLALHCARLDLPHPDGHLRVTAPLPPELVGLLETLGFEDPTEAG
jgi:tRNA pseudouridine65 synthase